jgi:hypothetical protein
MTQPSASITCPVTYTVSTTSSLYSSVTGATGSPYTFPTAAGNVVLNGASPTWTSGTGNITSTGNISGAGLHVTSDAEFEGNITWKGRDLGKLLETMERRLAILQPDPKKLKKFEALQKAYDHYKLLEALCHSEDDNE